MMLSDLQSKDIINIKNGQNLGRIIDVSINEDGKINYFIVEKRRFFFRMFFNPLASQKVLFSQIKRIGNDVILVEL